MNNLSVKEVKTLFTVEEKAKARKANLVEYFRSKGYKVEKVDNERYKVRGFGGLYIKNENCYYCFSAERGGNSIECLMNELNFDFVNAVKELLNYSTSDLKRNKIINKKEKNHIFKMPELNKDQHRVFAYLNKTRGIDGKLIAELIKNNLLFQTKKFGNIVFPYRNFNKEIVGAEIVGTTQTKRFKKIDKNTDDLTAYWLQYGEPKKIFVFESPIDLLSFICLNEKEKEFLSNSIFLSMSGLKYSVVKAFLEHFRPKQLYICIDNPTHSNEKDTVAISNFMKHFEKPNGEKVIRLLPKNKDWNDDLKERLNEYIK